MNVETAIEPVQLHEKHGRRPLPSIDSALEPEPEKKEERFRGSVLGTVRGPREMKAGHKKLAGARHASGQGRVSTDGHAANSSSIIVDTIIANHEEQNAATPLSFSQRAAELNRTTTPLLVQGDQHLLRDIDRAPPGDPPILRPRRKSLLSLTGSRRSINPGVNGGGGVGVNGNGANRRSSRILSESIAAAAAGEYSEFARKRSQYFEDIFSSRDGDNSPVKERIRSESLVLVEIRTNVHVGDEFTIITELSAHLACRYSRPLSSIVVMIQHGQCMCFGGSFDSAYIMSVTALPSQLQPTTNKRNAALIQKHMEEALGVPPARGYLRFVPIPETNLAYGGNTTIGHLDELARSASINGTVSGAGSGAGAGTGVAYSTHNAQSPHGGVYTSDSAKASVGETPAVQSQAVLSSGLGSRKHKAARKLSVKGISSTFRSPTASSEKTTVAASSVHDFAAPAKSNATAVAATTPTATALAVIPEQSLKEGNDSGKGRGRGREKAIEVVVDKSGGRIGIHELLARASTPQPADSGDTVSTVGTADAAVSRKPSRRARRTKSFVATFFGRSVSASAATT